MIKKLYTVDDDNPDDDGNGKKQKRCQRWKKRMITTIVDLWINLRAMIKVNFSSISRTHRVMKNRIYSLMKSRNAKFFHMELVDGIS